MLHKSRACKHVQCFDICSRLETVLTYLSRMLDFEEIVDEGKISGGRPDSAEGHGASKMGGENERLGGRTLLQGWYIQPDRQASMLKLCVERIQNGDADCMVNLIITQAAWQLPCHPQKSL